MTLQPPVPTPSSLVPLHPSSSLLGFFWSGSSTPPPPPPHPRSSAPPPPSSSTLVLLVPYRGPPRPVEGLLAAAADGFSASAPPRPSSSAPLQPTDGLRAGGLSPGLSDEEASLCFIGAPLVGRYKERMNAIIILGCLVGESLIIIQSFTARLQ